MLRVSLLANNLLNAFPVVEIPVLTFQRRCALIRFCGAKIKLSKMHDVILATFPK